MFTAPIEFEQDRPSVSLDSLRESDRMINEDFPLPVDGDDMIAVVEHQHFDEPPQVLLEIEGVLEAREIIVARMGDEDGPPDPREPRLEVVDELPKLIERQGMLARMSADRGIAFGDRLHDEGAHALILDAEGLALLEAVAPHRGQKPEPAQQELVLRDSPAVVPKRRSEAGNAVHSVRLERGKAQCQDRSNRQSAHNHGVANVFELRQRGFDACVPLLPRGREQLLLSATMARKLAAVHGKAAGGDAFCGHAHFVWHAAEPVHEQEASSAARDREASVLCRHRLLPISRSKCTCGAATSPVRIAAPESLVGRGDGKALRAILFIKDPRRTRSCARRSRPSVTSTGSRSMLAQSRPDPRCLDWGQGFAFLALLFWLRLRAPRRYRGPLASCL